MEIIFNAAETKQSELFAIFHDHGYTVYELNHCHIQHQVAGGFQPATIHSQQSIVSDVPHSPPKQGLTHELLCEANKTCSWGDAVNVRNSFIYATQPDLHRIVVIEVTNRMNPVEVGILTFQFIIIIIIIIIIISSTSSSSSSTPSSSSPSSSSVSASSHLVAAMCMNELPPLSSVFCQVHWGRP